MEQPATRRAVIYARVSVSAEESVSIARQVESAEQYAAARGWQVVRTYTDDGISATRSKPEDRAGWRDLIASADKFDAVIVWKIDRLARRVLDFLHADETLRDRGAGIVAVEQSIDMTSAEGRMIAQVLAIFAEYEAAAIASRVKAARNYLVSAGRVVGGTVPYGWRSVPNPSGPGLVLAQDPDRIGWVQGMADRAQRGDSIYSIKAWLDAEGAPLPTTSQSARKDGSTRWSYSTVERLLRNPVLAGMTAFNPDNKTKERGAEVLRDPETGLPVVDESVAILSTVEWRAMVAGLDQRDTPQSKPRATRSKTSALLSGLVRCADCTNDGSPARMWRGNANGRPAYYCPECRQVISDLDDFVIDEFLRQKGEHVRWSVMQEVHEGGMALLPEIEQRMGELATQLRATDDDSEAERLEGQISNLRRMRREARDTPTVVEYVPVRGTQTFGDDWAEATAMEDRRAILDDALESVTVARGRSGRRTPASVLARLTFGWKRPEDLGPLPTPDDATLARWASD